jgi:hypothetical protein
MPFVEITGSMTLREMLESKGLLIEFLLAQSPALQRVHASGGGEEK